MTANDFSPVGQPWKEQLMWQTSNGDRTLVGAEAALFAAALRTILNTFEEYFADDEDVEIDEWPAELDTGIGVFDALTLPQRVAMLHHVAEHLLTDREPNPDSSAIDDATIAAIFAEIAASVRIEIDFLPLIGDGDSTQFRYWRGLLRTAIEEAAIADNDDEIELPNADESDIAVWENALDLILSRILWDRDFEMFAGFMDEHPDSARRRRELLGIHEDYFVQPPLDPDAEQTRKLLAQAKSLVNRPARQ